MKSQPKIQQYNAVALDQFYLESRIIHIKMENGFFEARTQDEKDYNHPVLEAEAGRTRLSPELIDEVYEMLRAVGDLKLKEADALQAYLRDEKPKAALRIVDDPDDAA